jgi:hypothetical protein
LRSKDGVSHGNKLSVPTTDCPAAYMGSIGLGTATSRDTGRARREW